MLKKEAWLEYVFNNTGVGILIVDKNRTILEINQTFCDILGYSYDELINKNTKVIHVCAQSSKQFMNIALDTLSKKKSVALEYKFKHKNNSTIWLKITGETIRNNQKILWIVTDINQNVKFQKKLSKLNNVLSNKVNQQLEILREKDRQLQYQARLAQMGEILNMISHQWRQPLMSISATTSYLYGKLLIDEFDKDEFIKELELIENSSEHLSNTINDFRNFFKYDKEKTLTSFEIIIFNTLKIIEPILLKNHIKINTIIKSKSTIYTLENEIRQVVLNILKNAEDAFIENNKKNRKIDIKIYDNNDFTILEISDNAGGINPKHLNKIFDTYFTTKQSTNGTGLGLCMSKTIIEDNCKGILSAFNNQNGATFRIKLSISNSF